MELSYTELREREVINLIDGRSYGKICDIVFNYPEGQIFGIVVPGRRGINIFKCKNDIFIEWHKIKKIGKDVILVDLRSYEPPKNNKYDNCCGRDNGENNGNPKIDLNDYE